ncbi:hypothetical protein EMCRGX_G031934 [Ephydatia muelleri]
MDDNKRCTGEEYVPGGGGGGNACPLIGEVFVHFSSEETQERVEKAKLGVQEDLVRLRANSEEIKAILTNLKAKLYSRFGDNINLETEDL